MRLTTGTYFMLLILVFFAYGALARRLRWRVALLAGVGCLLYIMTGVRALMLLMALSLIDFTTTTMMDRSGSPGRRKLLLLISLVVDVGALCAFKYVDFWIESGAALLSLTGATLEVPTLDIVAPIGISFLIFQTIAYVIDVYRRDTPPAKTYLDYLAFVAFFPTIVAGPILRASQFLPQLRQAMVLDTSSGGRALFLIAIGSIKKFAIADYISVNLVDRVFDFPERFSSLEVLSAVYGYALQIYADFSGYSDVAIGSAMLLGFSLPANFNAPYRSRDLAEFWRRWHISLSTWLRDYLFFSLAGRRPRRTALYGAVIVTMLIGGLWHGASWTFVMWGLLHGVGLAFVRAVEMLRKRYGLSQHLPEWTNPLSVLVTFHFVCFSWILFRADTIEQAIGIVRQLLGSTTDTSNLSAPVVVVMGIGFAAHWLPDGLYEQTTNGFIRLPSLAQASALFVVAIGLYLVASSDIVPFIYSRF